MGFLPIFFLTSSFDSQQGYRRKMGKIPIYKLEIVMLRLSKPLAVAACLALCACGAHSVQTSSGADYLARYAPVKTASDPLVQRTVRSTDDGAEIIEDRIETLSTDALVRRAATIEPLMKLPARIGLARIEHGQLAAIPAGEAQDWLALAARHPGLGAFAVIDPFVARYTAQTVLPQDGRALRRDARDVITLIRMGAARQHMDAVLITEIGARGENGLGFDGLSRIRVLGAAPLPATAIEKEGIARAFLMDVRNGYPYGIASASVDLKSFERGIFDDGPKDHQQIAMRTTIAKALMTKVDAMIADLVRANSVRLASAK